MEQKALTSRQWRLKIWLEQNHISGLFHSIEEIVENVHYGDGEKCYELNTDPKCHDKCIALSGDVRAINWNNNEGWKIIIKNSKGGIKLAETREEFMSWWQKEYDAIETKYQYLNNLKSKADRDGVMPVLNQKLNPVEELKPIEVYTMETEEQYDIEVSERFDDLKTKWLVDLIKRTALEVKHIKYYSYNPETCVVKVRFGNGTEITFYDKHEILDPKQIEKDFYSSYEKIKWENK